MFLSKQKINQTGETKKASLHNPKILEVNLVKNEVKASFDWSTNLLFSFLVFLFAAFLVAEIYFGLNWWEKQQNLKNEAIQKQADILVQETNKLKKTANEAVAFKEKSLAFSSLIDNHVYWNNFFSWLEKYTLSSVKYSAFDGDLSGVYVLSATAKSYADVSWQVKSFLMSSSTKKVEVLQAQTASEKDKSKSSEVSFQLKLEVDPAIFKNK